MTDDVVQRIIARCVSHPTHRAIRFLSTFGGHCESHLIIQYSVGQESIRDGRAVAN